MDMVWAAPRSALLFLLDFRVERTGFLSRVMRVTWVGFGSIEYSV